MHAVHVIPWSFAWTALIAVPAALIREHELYFDLDFHGYGVEDLEWAHRLTTTGTPIVMGADVYGIHLPHVRSVAANQRTEAVNYRRFLRKWPGIDVELAGAFGDFEANARCRDYTDQLRAAVGTDHAGGSLAVLRGEVDGVSTILIGAVVDAEGNPLEPKPEGFEVLRLTGLALPWNDGEVEQARVLPPVSRIGEPYQERILAEARRVAIDVVVQKQDG
jgi:hypothetical protein